MAKLTPREPSEEDREEFVVQLLGVLEVEAPEDQPGSGLLLKTSRGGVGAFLHPCPGSQKAVLWVWGARGGFDGPAEGIYGVLAEELKGEGITSLRLNYRQPGVFHESVMDVLAGLSYLIGSGYDRIALVGHSFGGAVVICAASFTSYVKAVVALSSQTLGAQNVASVSPRPLLLVHGGGDSRLPPYCSETIYQWAREPKELVIYPGAEHRLLECKDQLHGLLKRWLVEKLDAAQRINP